MSFAVGHLQVGCFSKCNKAHKFTINGSCDYCNGYCCRSDGRNSYCSDELVNQFKPKMTPKRHVCIDKAESKF